MSVLVDTSIWSLALRRRGGNLSGREKRLVDEWAALVESGAAVLVGPIRQEMLSGVRRGADFAALQRHLSAFGCIEIIPEDYDRAAAFFNVCRSRGVVGTSVDLLICAVAARVDVAIFTADRDFHHYARHLPIRVHEPGGE